MKKKLLFILFIALNIGKELFCMGAGADDATAETERTFRVKPNTPLNHPKSLLRLCTPIVDITTSFTTFPLLASSQEGSPCRRPYCIQALDALRIATDKRGRIISVNLTLLEELIKRNTKETDAALLAQLAQQQHNQEGLLRAAQEKLRKAQEENARLKEQHRAALEGLQETRAEVARSKEDAQAILQLAQAQRIRTHPQQHYQFVSRGALPWIIKTPTEPPTRAATVTDQIDD